ncbi:hypothetical protein K7J14_16065 [Treponema zuelzerae]|uniref:Uncharacterized protein n=1 Tax=Teretinema zuelzerae TaxID=156 RepID=A0AAE3EJK2_9SPIR|nr:hypothetical protein [Teretinema zuelzerae]MCD1656210.1 hypothetical protein [Teretinema zuelzerae]
MSFTENYSTPLFISTELVATVNDEIVRFFSFEKDSWKSDPSANLTLPVGCSDVSLTSVLGNIVVATVDGNIVRFFSFEKDSWKSDPSANLTLPVGCSDVL